MLVEIFLQIYPALSLGDEVRPHGQGWAITGFYPVETETNPENTRPIDTTRD